jgi:hypothetical protein
MKKRCCDCGQKINNDDYYSVIVMGEKRIFCQRCYDSIVAMVREIEMAQGIEIGG